MTMEEKRSLLIQIWEESVKKNTFAVYKELIYKIENNKFIIIGNTFTAKIDYLHIDSIFDGIDSFSFFDCQYIKTVKLGHRCRFVGDYAFCNSSITNIYCNKNLKSIDNYAFCNSKLKYFYYNGDIVNLGDYAFCNTRLISISLGNKLQELGNNIFKSCLSLRYCQFSGSFKTLPFRTFYGCRNLKEFVCCSSIKSIEALCFYDCINLKKVVTTKNLTNHERKVFYNCNSLQEYIIIGLSFKSSWSLYKFMDDILDNMNWTIISDEGVIDKIVVNKDKNNI